MRLSINLLLCLVVLAIGCKSSRGSSAIIGTWISADHPVPAGCDTKLVFTSDTEYFEDPGTPGLTPPRKGTVHVIIGGSPNTPNQFVIQNPATGFTDDFDLTDATHAIGGSVAQCHYAKQ
ncbi:MAG TPA: hypothetical protein VGG45_16910 [Terracidiphilus sp.]|jgi:hypothetical protein